jgi:hypothetical protein
MAQGYECFCGAETCRGFISGAKDMGKGELEGVWLNAHIRGLLEERDGTKQTNGKGQDATEAALVVSLKQAEKVVEAAKHALSTYVSNHGKEVQNGEAKENGVGNRELSGEMGGDIKDNGVGGKRRGVTSREMSGEMGGDTSFPSKEI